MQNSIFFFFICKSWSSVKSQILLSENLKQGFLRGVCFQRKNLEPLLGAGCHTRSCHVEWVGFQACSCSQVKSFSWFVSLLCGICTGVGPLTGARLDHFWLSSSHFAILCANTRIPSGGMCLSLGRERSYRRCSSCPYVLSSQARASVDYLVLGETGA